MLGAMFALLQPRLDAGSTKLAFHFQCWRGGCLKYLNLYASQISQQVVDRRLLLQLVFVLIPVLACGECLASEESDSVEQLEPIPTFKTSRFLCSRDLPGKPNPWQNPPCARRLLSLLGDVHRFAPSDAAAKEALLGGC